MKNDQIENKIKTYVESIRPKEGPDREKSDIGYTFIKNELILFETKKRFDGKLIQFQFAKTKYIKSTDKWKIYWLQGDLKWYSYRFQPEVESIDDFFKVIDENNWDCFTH